MPAFEPIGEVARWRTVYELLLLTDMGGVVTYAELGEALELDPDLERIKIQGAVRRAAQEYEEVDKRALEVVPGRGYRVVQAVEHMRLARRHQLKANKSLVRGHSKVVNVDLSKVDAETRKALELFAAGFAVQMDFNRRAEAEQKRLETVVSAVARQQERSADQIAELRARLDRLDGGEAEPAGGD